MTPEAQAVLEFWFADAAQGAEALERRANFWFGMGQDAAEIAALDDLIRSRFAHLFEQGLRGELGSWAGSPRGRLALIILLDQFSRNIHRGTARAFAGDAAALALTTEGLKTGADRLLSAYERVFFCMPLQHAESLAMQEKAVEAFRSLVHEADEQQRAFVESCVPYALQHRDIIRRFGRFPHRNAILGRASTLAERAYLVAGAPDFGQQPE
ncbi:MAG TPA: DUF924 family protein [Steroidobacteraceae bacterium]|nr:DUF924 family protein [Steroidobacteraceae bacterium]